LHAAQVGCRGRDGGMGLVWVGTGAACSCVWVVCNSTLDGAWSS
jgi:hypothetical protein